jgi:EEF1A lysine methyltransferase 4
MPVRVRREGEDATFDWFKRYEDVVHLLRPILPDRTARILMLGCGNSTLSEDVHSELQNSCARTHHDSDVQ